MPRLVEYLDERSRSPFGQWLDRLEAVTAARIARALYRLGEGNDSNVKSVGSGISELRVDFGPGYRVYFARVGADLLLLLGGGSKRRQSVDIVAARERLRSYRLRRVNRRGEAEWP